MPTSQEALAERLVRENHEYRKLHQKHRSFEERLDSLNARQFLTEDEKREVVALKKQKLSLKDRMAEIAREHR